MKDIDSEAAGNALKKFDTEFHRRRHEGDAIVNKLGEHIKAGGYPEVDYKTLCRLAQTMGIVELQAGRYGGVLSPRVEAPTDPLFQMLSTLTEEQRKTMLQIAQTLNVNK